MTAATEPPTCPSCGVAMAPRPLAGQTPEQKWCGQWFDHPPIPGVPSGSLFGHPVSVLIESPELAATRTQQLALL